MDYPGGDPEGGGGGGGGDLVEFSSKRGGGGGPTTYRYSGAICIEIFSKKEGVPLDTPPPPPPPNWMFPCYLQCLVAVIGSASVAPIGPDEQELLLSAWNITSAQYTHSELVLTKNSTVMKGKDVLCSKQNRTRDEQEVSVTKYSVYLKFGDMLDSARNN